MGESIEKKQAATAAWKKAVSDHFCKKMNDQQKIIFLATCQKFQADPFKREAFGYVDNQGNLVNVISREHYRKKAQSLPGYMSHYAEAVYENDCFEVLNGIPNHKYGLSNRGKLLGAYCILYVKSSPRPFFVYVDFAEYNKGQSTWRQIPATMIKKVAEAQCCRMAFGAEYENTITTDEYEVMAPVFNNQLPDTPAAEASTPEETYVPNTDPEPPAQSSEPEPETEKTLEEIQYSFYQEMLDFFKEPGKVSVWLQENSKFTGKNGQEYSISSTTQIRSIAQANVLKGKFRKFREGK